MKNLLKKIFSKSFFAKKNIIIVSIFLIVIVLITILLIFSRDSLQKTQQLKIEYKDSKTINISNIKKGDKYKKTIVVTNDTGNDLYYKVRWKKVKNSFTEQNKLFYKLDTHDANAYFVAESQAPTSDFVLNNKVKIGKDEIHKYEIIFIYKGNIQKEKNSTFDGILEFEQINN